MNLTNEQLLMVEEMAAALLSPSDISILLKLSSNDRKIFEEIIKNHLNSPVYMAFHYGRLTTKLELQKTVVKLAKHGSPAAEQMADKYILEQLR